MLGSHAELPSLRQPNPPLEVSGTVKFEKRSR